MMPAGVTRSDGSEVRQLFELRSDVPGVNGKCAWLGADNSTDAVNQWLVKSFQLASPGPVRVTTSWQVGPVGGPESMKSAIGVISTRGPPRDRDDFTVLGPIGVHPRHDEPWMMDLRLEEEVVAASDTELVIAVGYGNHFETWNGTCLDNIIVDIDYLDR